MGFLIIASILARSGDILVAEFGRLVWLIHELAEKKTRMSQKQTVQIFASFVPFCGH
jgi:hypothetical protein